MNKKVAMWASAVFAAGVVIAGASAPAQAYEEGPYCWENYGRLGQGKVCRFYTFEQCVATASGVGGTCSQNPWYHYNDEEPSPVPPPRHRKVRRHVPN